MQDQIRDSIASQKAAENIGVIFDELQGARCVATATIRWTYETRDEKDTAIKAPTPFPFAELAEKHGIDATELPLVTATEVAAEDIGKVSRDRAAIGARSSVSARESFAEFAFSAS